MCLVCRRWADHKTQNDRCHDSWLPSLCVTVMWLWRLVRGHPSFQLFKFFRKYISTRSFTRFEWTTQYSKLSRLDDLCLAGRRWQVKVTCETSFGARENLAFDQTQSTCLRSIWLTTWDPRNIRYELSAASLLLAVIAQCDQRNPPVSVKADGRIIADVWLRLRHFDLDSSLQTASRNNLQFHDGYFILPARRIRWNQVRSGSALALSHFFSRSWTTHAHSAA